MATIKTQTTKTQQACFETIISMQMIHGVTSDGHKDFAAGVITGAIQLYCQAFDTSFAVTHKALAKETETRRTG